MNKHPKLTYFHLLATMISLGFAILLVIIFFAAAFSPDHRITITVNEFNEMMIEIFLFPVFIGLTTWNAIDRWRRYRRGQ